MPSMLSAKQSQQRSHNVQQLQTRIRVFLTILQLMWLFVQCHFICDVITINIIIYNTFRIEQDGKMGTRTVDDKQSFPLINFCAKLVKSSYPRRQTPTTSHTPITCTSGLFVFTALNIVWWTELAAVWPQQHMLLRG